MTAVESSQARLVDAVPEQPPAGPPGETAEPAGYRFRWIALAVILLGGVMELLDGTITNIAGPTMRVDLGGGASVLQWFSAAYILAMTTGLLTGGRLGDIYGRRRMFLVGATGFLVGSLLCATAQSPEMMIGARVVQGLFGAAMVPQGIGMIKEMFPPQQIQAAFGLFGPVIGASQVGGPILAGWLLDANLFGTGWRMIFLINLPIGVVLLLGALRFLPESRSADPLKLDVFGVVLASVASFLLIYPLVQGREYGWPAWTFLMIAASAVLFAAFGWYQARVGRTGGDPLIVASLFRKRAFTGGLAFGVMLFAVGAGFVFVFNLYTQLGLGYGPLKAGLAVVPFPVAFVFGMGAAQALKKLGRAVVLTGAVVQIAGMVTLLLTIRAAGADLSPWQAAPGVAIVGFGWAMMMGPFYDTVLAGVEPHENGSASGALTSIQQLGSAFGIALIGTIFFDTVGAAGAFGDAAQTVLWSVVGLLVVTFAVTFLLPKHPRETTP